MDLEKQSGSVSKDACAELPGVLVVDDNVQLLRVLEEVLTSHGFRVTACSQAVQALAALRSERPDLILCDIMMPDIDGFRLHDELKQNPDWCDIPFVYLTALSSPEEVRFGKELGCDEYVTKPFDPDDLSAMLRGKIAIAKVRQQRQRDAAEKFRKRIVHTLSHEFRTPLVAINTGTELLLEQHNQIEPARLERLLESIQRGGMRLQRLVEDFMTLQQIDSGSAANLTNRFRRIASFRKIAELALDGYHDYMRGEKYHIMFRPDQDALPTMVDVYDIQIIAIIHRILANALKFGGTEKPVVMWTASTPEAVSLHIRDRGPGLPEHLTEHACALFQQIDREKNEQQGCGIGLTISRYFAELNGGELFFRAPADGEGGLEVELRLPRAHVS